jgi:hypothetical protein
LIPENIKSKEIERPPRRQRDLSDIAGTWSEDPAFDAALAEQDAAWQTHEGTEPDSSAGKANS